MKRLNIVVPYRARDAHLKNFIRCVSLYFARDKTDRDIPYQVLVIEQEDGLPFNSGALKNIGFVLGREFGDYTCFHDVDYLPVWADYSWPEQPAAIVWYGAEARPIRVGEKRALRPDPEKVFGCVVLASNADFARVNGFSNSYWGWGFEDTDLKNRFDRDGIGMGRRKGTFEALDHDSNGFQADGSPNPIALANHRRFQSRWAAGAQMPEDGLSTMAFEILGRRKITEGLVTERPASWEMITVRLPPPQNP